MKKNLFKYTKVKFLGYCLILFLFLSPIGASAQWYRQAIKYVDEIAESIGDFFGGEDKPSCFHQAGPQGNGANTCQGTVCAWHQTASGGHYAECG